MNIYSTSNYRKIWEEANNQKIPQNYHIHHIDGNRDNNDPSNLICVSPQEHYDIHYSQKDWGACYLLMKDCCLTLSSEERSYIARQNALRRVEEGTHNLLGPDMNRKRIEAGTHNLLKQNGGSEKARKNNLLRMEKGTHIFITNNPASEIVTCPYCNKTGARPAMLRWHFDKCKFKSY